MGTDIHGYIDYDSFKTREGDWWVTNFAKLHLVRDYELFYLLAGVRDYGYKDFVPGVPRGLPDRVSWVVRKDNGLYIVDGETDEEYYVSRKQAEKWIDMGLSKWTDDNHRHITHPDWHSHSWMSWVHLQDVSFKLKQIAQKNNYDYNQELDAIIAAMKVLCPPEDSTRARFVFWFDD